MPILWRYLLGQYLKVFLLTLTAFIGVLLVSRLDEIAHFAALGGTARFVFRFTIHQIPYILPIAIPISALVSSTLLFQGMSDNQELTAMRAAGLSLRRVIAPVLVAAAFLSVLNFYIISEGATSSHLATRRLEMEVRSMNPLLFLQNPRMVSSKGAYVDTLGRFKNGEYADDVLLALLNKDRQRLNLILTERVTANRHELRGQNIAIISASPAPKPHWPDHLMIENIGSGSSSIEELSHLIKKGGWSLKADHLQMSLLLVKYRMEAAKLKEMAGASAEEILVQEKAVNRCLSEFSRRSSLSLAVFAFTYLGCAFGIDIRRNRSMQGIIVIVAITALYLSCFFAGKGFADHFIAASCAYLLPLVVAVALSSWKIGRVNKGVE